MFFLMRVYAVLYHSNKANKASDSVVGIPVPYNRFVCMVTLHSYLVPGTCITDT